MLFKSLCSLILLKSHVACVAGVGNGILLQALVWIQICTASQGRSECLDLRNDGLKMGQRIDADQIFSLKYPSGHWKFANFIHIELIK